MVSASSRRLGGVPTALRPSKLPWKPWKKYPCTQRAMALQCPRPRLRPSVWKSSYRSSVFSEWRLPNGHVLWTVGTSMAGTALPLQPSFISMGTGRDQDTNCYNDTIKHNWQLTSATEWKKGCAEKLLKPWKFGNHPKLEGLMVGNSEGIWASNPCFPSKLGHSQWSLNT